ncbi:MAG TPA: FkbM family methyltransferase, partial [Bacteroidales bacterium]|nr:FkbM family methyltransferase [Bacteroidales bacterium]
EAEVHTLGWILEMTGIKKADILKMDIEGAEYKVIQNIQALDFRPQQILIEFHHRFPEIQLSDTRTAIKTLNELGYKIFYISPNGEEYSFFRG